MPLNERKYMQESGANHQPDAHYVFDSVQDRYVPREEWVALQEQRRAKSTHGAAVHASTIATSSTDGGHAWGRITLIVLVVAACALGIALAMGYIVL